LKSTGLLGGIAEDAQVPVSDLEGIGNQDQSPYLLCPEKSANADMSNCRIGFILPHGEEIMTWARKTSLLVSHDTTYSLSRVPLADFCNPVLYIFFKFFLNSKMIPVEAIDLRTEFESIRQEREAGEKVGMDKSGSNRLEIVVARMRSWI
jgi:hypothetical protein